MTDHDPGPVPTQADGPAVGGVAIELSEDGFVLIRARSGQVQTVLALSPEHAQQLGNGLVGAARQARPGLGLEVAHALPAPNGGVSKLHRR